MKIKITSYTRLHFGLISMNEHSHRIDGGFGLYVNLPSAEIFIENDKKICVKGYNDKYYEKILKENEKYLELSKVKVVINNIVDPHVGLGLKTQISMALLQGLKLFAGNEINLTDMLPIIKRGGTSGIGIHSFLNGGFTVDGGHLWGIEKNKLCPSADVISYKLSPLIVHKNFPNWGICIIIPNTKKHVYGKQETKLFSEFTPILQSEIDSLCKWILMGVIPAIQNNDLESFGYSLNNCMHLGFKKKEIEFWQENVKYYINILKEANFKGVGMTSFGPTVFGFTQDIQTAYKYKSILLQKLKVGDQIYITNCRNSKMANINIID